MAAVLMVLASPLSAQQTMVPDATALAVQEGLTALGYDPGPTDGKPGPATKRAIEQYQRDNQLPVDGVATRELAEHIDIAVTRAGNSPELILARGNMLRSYTRAIQEKLTMLGYDPGPVDGAVGSQTRAAIMQYESDNGLPQRGQVSKALLAHMHGLDGS